jgi:UDP-glucose 4-epimerase
LSAGAADRVLVTGASGFIGQHLVAELRRGGGEVVAPPRREIGPDTDWSDALRGVRSVVHLAALAHERTRRYEAARQYEPLRRVNALGTERLARMAAAAGVRHFVFVSTIGVHGDETFGQPLTEQSSLAPHSLYAASKLEAERLLEALARTSGGLGVTVLRPTLVYGPGNPGNLLTLLRAIARGMPLPLAAIRNRRRLTFVGNLVSAVCAVLAAGGRGEAFIVCDAESVSTPQLVSCLAAGMGRPARLFPLPRGVLRFAAKLIGREHTARRVLGSLEADCDKLARALAWRPPFGAEHGLRETGAWYRRDFLQAKARG